MTIADIRVGQGFDVHPFSDDPDRPLVLGGVRFEGVPGLAGHSDGDALIHCIVDALLGAAGLGDIGQHFPDDDQTLAGADSMMMLRSTVGAVAEGGWRTGNVDCTVITNAPRLAPQRKAIQDGLSEIIDAPVSVKGKRPEGLGALGRDEGVACFAVALLLR